MVAEHFDVLIVGAGLSGIAAAFHLQKRCPNHSYTIIEARNAIGGTWDLFRYPGIRSDSDMYTFGFAFRPWTEGKVFADGKNIREYVRDTARENGIDQKIRFGQRVMHSRWNSRTARWTVNVSRSDGAEELSYTCNFLIMCSGYYRYDRGHMPDFPGMKDFGGEIIHPQFWPEDTDYTDKRVLIIGSGATAITLVPAMAKTARQVTMLQRSPSYVAARPSRDAMADVLRKFLPDKLIHSMTRAKNIMLAIYFYEMARRWPDLVRSEVMKRVKKELGDDFDVKTHFSPKYNPWDQRFCLAPDGDFFQALKNGTANIVTDHIDHFTEKGIKLKSGTELQADLIIPATGLELQILGGAKLTIDEKPFMAAESFTYRGMMLSQVPNFALALGYTNSSWTLKVDLTCERICRMLTFMRKKGHDYCVAVPPQDLKTMPLLDFSSGYVQRAVDEMPKQSENSPWRTYQNYIQDMLTIRLSGLEDGTMEFHRCGNDES
jgi:monooxygenase